MPIYEYQCDKCGYEFEREQRMSDPPIKTCPKCKSRKVIKLISRSSFVLKGGGWYADGYADAKGGKSSTDSTGSSDSSSSDSTTKPDKKEKKSGDKKPSKKSGSSKSKKSAA